MKVKEFLVIGMMPFFYGSATRLPFIYFVIHLVDNFEVDMLWVGIYVALYQASRVVTSTFSIVLPKLSHFMGTSIGLAGFITVYLSDNNLLTPFVAGTVMVGFSECMSSMQKYAKVMYQNESDRELASRKLRYQYAAVMLGVVFAFSVGGFVYQYKFIDGVALFGIIVEALALASFFLYFLLELNSSATDPNNLPPTSSTRSVVEDVAAFVNRIRTLSILTKMVNDANAKFDKDKAIAATWVNWIMCISFGIEALTIGYNLSIGPIFMLNQFNRQTSIIGIMFAVGSASGTLAAVSVTCTDTGRKRLKKIADSPFDICFAMLGIGTGVLVAAIPSFPVHVAGVILLMCFNDLGATLMTELQASISTTNNYRLLGPMGQVVRRSLNVVTALTGPLLFGVYPRIPYFVAGGVTLIWTTILYGAFKSRFKKTLAAIGQKTGYSQETVAQRTNFATAEVVTATNADIRANIDQNKEWWFTCHFKGRSVDAAPIKESVQLPDNL
eukprot:scaffold3275_cov70-Cyclotella_meneghiniana.AAC.7